MPYKSILNYIGLSQLLKPPDIPDYHLMVGSAECLESLPLAIYKDYLPAQAMALVEPLQNMSAEDVDPDLVGKTYTPNDFIYDDWFLGNPTGGFN